MLVFRIFLLSFSLFGYFFYFNQKKKIDIAIVPILTFSLIGIIMFLAGFLNIMVLASYAIIIVGVTLIITCKPWNSIRKGDNPSRRERILFVVFCGLNILMLFRVYKEVPLHYDNFSHWLTVIREMVNTDRMPNFQSELIVFQGYPTGSAGFIYFVCKVLSLSREDIMLFSQGMLLISALYTLFAFIDRFSFFAVAAILICSVFCLSVNTKITDLLVDTLVSVISIAVVTICVYYRKKPRSAIVLTLPLQVYLIAVKNSGILMVGINFALMLAVLMYTHRKQLNKEMLSTICIYMMCSLFSCVCIYYLWMQHVKYVFPGGENSKHTASVSNYLNVLQEKNLEQIKSILSNFLNRLFSWNTTWLILALLCLVLCIGMLTRRYILKIRNCVEPMIVLSLLFVYLGFMVVLAVMYLVSMPYDEAVVLASYERYEYTILVYIVGIVSLYIIHIICEIQKNTVTMNMVIGLILLVFLSTLSTKTSDLRELFVKEDEYQNSIRCKLEEICVTYQIPKGSSYVLVINPNLYSGGYCYFMGRYVLWSADVEICSEDKLPDDIEDRDFLILLDENDAVIRYLEENGYTRGQRAYKLDKEV